MRPVVEGTEAQWLRAQRLFADGLSYALIQERLEEESGRPLMSAPRIRRRAIAETWVRSDTGPGSLGPPKQTLEERKERAAVFIAAGEFNLAKRMEYLTQLLSHASERLVQQMFEPHEVVEIKVVPAGLGSSNVEIVRVLLPEPSPKDKQALGTAASQLIDRLQILSGGVTSRTEIGPIADRAQAESKLRMIRDELAERRVVERNAGVVGGDEELPDESIDAEVVE